jgi:hypothetical protein
MQREVPLQHCPAPRLVRRGDEGCAGVVTWADAATHTYGQRDGVFCRRRCQKIVAVVMRRVLLRCCSGVLTKGCEWFDACQDGARWARVGVTQEVLQVH